MQMVRCNTFFEFVRHKCALTGEVIIKDSEYEK